MSNLTFQERIQKIQEIDLTKNILVPLLLKLNYHRVDYHGGRAEEGKDLICWGKNRIGKVELAVAQVKRFRFSKNSYSNRAFSAVVTQLSQCAEKKLPCADDQKEYLPNTIYLITPFKIETGVLQSRFEGLSSLSKANVVILDGPIIEELVILHLPAKYNEIIGGDTSVSEAIAPTLTNEALNRALRISTSRPISQTYLDLDFLLGRPEIGAFLNSKFSPRKIPRKFEEEAWVEFTRKRKAIVRLLGVDFLETPESEIINNYAKAKIAFALEKEKLESERIIYETKQSDLRDAENALRENLSAIFHTSQALETLLIRSSQAESLTRPSELRREILRLIVSRIATLSPWTTAHLSKIGNDAEDLIATYLSQLSNFKALKEDPITLTKPQLQIPNYQFEIDGAGLAARVESVQKSISAKIEHFNKTQPDTDVLEKFLNECAEFFSAIQIISTDPCISGCLGAEFEVDLDKVGIMRPLSISLHKVFQTRVNLIVLGEAGSGKTTTLQAYACNLNRNGELKNERIAVFIPLARAAAVTNQKFNGRIRTRDVEDFNAPQSKDVLSDLTDLIECYLTSIGLAVNRAFVISRLKSGSFVLLLDGIDEALSLAPWLIDAIAQTEKEFPKCQIIVSSRVSTDIAKKLTAMVCTLRPFSPIQRKRFISNWFGRQQIELAERINAHLLRERRFAATVRNPLLATVLCTLAESGVPLPTSELRLYEERFRLLLGYYDVAKNISRFSLATQDLHRLSRRCALHMHKQGERQMPREFFQRIAKVTFDCFDDPILHIKAVEELVDPGNVLVPMTLDGKLGFGHLRFQEYLVATELLSDRSIDLIPFLKNSWWKDVLLMFSELSETIDWMLYSVAENENSDASWSMIDKMIERRSKRERNDLRKLAALLSTPQAKNLRDDVSFLNEEFDTLDMI